MKIIHGTWIPQTTTEFIQNGAFFLWVEIDSPSIKRDKKSDKRHPGHLGKDKLSVFLNEELKLPAPKDGTLNENLTTKYFLLPSSDRQPLPSPELSRYLETEPPEATQWQIWEIDCYHLTSVIKLLNEIHFFSLYNVAEMHWEQTYSSGIITPNLSNQSFSKTNIFLP